MNKILVLKMLLLSLVVIICALFFIDDSEVRTITDGVGDEFGNYYYLNVDVNSEDIKFTKMNQEGKIIFNKKLPHKDGELTYKQKKISIDANNNIYILTYVERGSNNLLEERIERYDQEGNYLENVYEIIYDDGREHYTSSPRLRDIKIFNNKLYIYDYSDTYEVDDAVQLDILELNISNYILNDIKRITFPDKVYLSEVLYTQSEDIYFTTRKAELYHVSTSGETLEIALDSLEREIVIPVSLTSGAGGECYFVDAYSGDFIRYNNTEKSFDVIYNSDDIMYIEDGKEIQFREIRNIHYIGNNNFIGTSRITYYEKSFLLTFGNESSAVFDIYNHLSKKIYNVARSVVLALLIVGMIIFIRYLIMRKTGGRISVVWKQIVLFIPLTCVVMLLFFKWLNTDTEHLFMNETYLQLYTASTSIAELMDGQGFSELDYINNYKNDDYLRIQKQIKGSMSDYESVFKSGNKGKPYYVSYYLHNKNGEQRLNVAISMSIQSGLPIEYIYEKKVCDIYYEAIKTGEAKFGRAVDDYGEWAFAITPIRDNNGNIVGLIEKGFAYETIASQTKTINMHVIVIVGVGFGLLIIIFIIMINYSFKSLKELKSTISEVAAGRWDVRANVNSKDEFGEIGKVVNSMSSHIQDYIEELKEINQSYERFVPAEIISVLKKNTIQELSLGDQVTEEMTALYINIGNFKSLSMDMSNEETFTILNKIYNIIVSEIKKQDGIIENYAGANIHAIFNKSTVKAIQAAGNISVAINQFNLERKKYNQEEIEIHMAVHRGKVMLGIVGQKNRVSTTTLSEDIDISVQLTLLAKKYKIQTLLTESVLSKVRSKEKYMYRYIGRISDSIRGGYINLYESYEGCHIEEVNRREMTKKIFEDSIKNYIDGNIYEARKGFIYILKRDSTDFIARRYVFLCSESPREIDKDTWTGVIAQI